jgi:hypothetical protein
MVATNLGGLFQNADRLLSVVSPRWVAFVRIFWISNFLETNQKTIQVATDFVWGRRMMISHFQKYFRRREIDDSRLTPFYTGPVQRVGAAFEINVRLGAQLSDRVRC